MVTEPATETKPEPEIVQTEVRRTFCCGFYLPLLMRETQESDLRPIHSKDNNYKDKVL